VAANKPAWFICRRFFDSLTTENDMATYILDEHGDAVEATWEEYAEWWCHHKDGLILGSHDVRDDKDKYVTTVRTRYRGSIENLKDMIDTKTGKPKVWITEAEDVGLSIYAVTQKEAEINHRRAVQFLKNCYKSNDVHGDNNGNIKRTNNR
jgi:hypothetical protein